MTKVLLSVILLIIAILISEIKKFGFGMELIIGGIRAFAQLVAIGYVLNYIFALNNLPSQLLLLFFMAMVGTFTARNRAKKMPGAFTMSFFAILIGTVSSLGLLIVMKIIKTTPEYLIPLGGMIIGNTMNASALFLARIYDDIKEKRSEIESLLVLGLPGNKAVERLVKNSIRTSLIPTLNRLKVVGLIQLPGAMTGMLIAGSKPIEAAKIQIIVMYMITSGVVISALVISILCYKFIFNKNCQLKEQLYA